MLKNKQSRRPTDVDGGGDAGTGADGDQDDPLADRHADLLDQRRAKRRTNLDDGPLTPDGAASANGESRGEQLCHRADAGHDADHHGRTQTAGRLSRRASSASTDVNDVASRQATFSCGHLMLHESITTNGTARMAVVKRVPAAAHGPLVFQPGGYHLMRMPAASQLKPGESTRVSLRLLGGERRLLSADRRASPGRGRLILLHYG